MDSLSQAPERVRSGFRLPSQACVEARIDAGPVATAAGSVGWTWAGLRQRDAQDAARDEGKRVSAQRVLMCGRGGVRVLEVKSQ